MSNVSVSPVIAPPSPCRTAPRRAGAEPRAARGWDAGARLAEAADMNPDPPSSR